MTGADGVSVLPAAMAAALVAAGVAITWSVRRSRATVRQLAEFPTGDRYLFVARAIEKPVPSFSAPRHLLSIMLACDHLQADGTVYGDGMDLSSAAATTPVGATCRLCVRRDCAYREEDPIINA